LAPTDSSVSEPSLYDKDQFVAVELTKEKPGAAPALNALVRLVARQVVRDELSRLESIIRAPSNKIKDQSP
jgi:hypothetical protein